jgi:putative addiction module component (TIGR02574 family)
VIRHCFADGDGRDYDASMSLPLHVVTTEAMALDPADRLRLAAELIDSVEGAENPEWSAAWSAEIQRRTADADARAARGEPRGVLWEDVRARVLARLGRA